MSEVRSVKKFISDPDSFSEFVHSQNEPVYITKDGYADMVVMTVEKYEELLHKCDLGRIRATKEVGDSEGIERLPYRDVLEMMEKTQRFNSDLINGKKKPR